MPRMRQQPERYTTPQQACTQMRRRVGHTTTEPPGHARRRLPPHRTHDAVRHVSRYVAHDVSRRCDPHDGYRTRGDRSLAGPAKQTGGAGSVLMPRAAVLAPTTARAVIVGVFGLGRRSACGRLSGSSPARAVGRLRAVVTDVPPITKTCRALLRLRPDDGWAVTCASRGLGHGWATVRTTICGHRCPWHRTRQSGRGRSVYPPEPELDGCR